MYRILTAAVLGGMMIGGTGCTTVAKRAFGEVRGASSKCEEIPGMRPSVARFQGVEIMPPRTDLGGLVRAEFKRTLPAALKKELTQREGDKPALFPGGTPTLTIDPEICFYHPGGGLLGSDSYAVVLFWLKSDGADVGRVQVTTKSSAARTGPDDLANSAAKGLAKYFEDLRPKKGG